MTIQKPKILFVDDEALLLSALQRALRSIGGICQPVFAVGPHRALELFRHEQFTIVVSDMRMPEIDGAMLLAKVRSETPDTVRIILSGQATSDTFVRSLAVTHQYMSKPVDGEKFKNLLVSLLTTSDIVENPLIRRKISQLSALPIRQSTLEKLRQMATDCEIRYPELAFLAKKDMGFLARLIHIGGMLAMDHEKIASVEDVISRCGTEILIKTFECESLFAPVSDTSPLGKLLEEVAAHSFSVAESVEGATRHLDTTVRSHLYLSALMHDVGKMLIAQLFQDEFKNSLMTNVAYGHESPEIERKVIGADHAEIGAYLAALWGMPMSIVRGILFHNRTDHSNESLGHYLQLVHRSGEFEYAGSFNQE